MITIYIDDSGTSNLNEPSQPITLFSAVCVNNKSLHSIEKSIRGLLSLWSRILIVFYLI